MGKGWGAVIACAGLCATLSATPASATFPGQNGKIAYTDLNDVDIAVINPDGTGRTELTSDPALDYLARWSPDGSKIAFLSRRDGSDNIYVMDADGANQIPLTTSPGTDLGHRWSPDGSRIAFSSNHDGDHDVYVMDADGSNQVQVTNLPASDSAPRWSPDGTKLVFNHSDFPQGIPDRADIYSVNTDGSGLTLLTGESDRLTDDRSGHWSPDGNKIAFESETGPGPPQLWTMNPNGSGKQQLTQGGHSLTVQGWAPTAISRILIGWGTSFFGGSGFDNTWAINPDGTGLSRLTDSQDTHGGEAWSPDARFVVGYRIFCPDEGSCTENRVFVMRSDGSGLVELTSGVNPDWQPIPVNAYPRPKGASPTRVSLVPAYEPCTSPDRTHGPPLAFGSCSSPTQASGQLTVGSPDANGRPAKSVSYLRVNPLRSDPSPSADEADVRLRAFINDVRVASDLSDYTGDLEARLTIQITDRDNTPHPGGPGAATVQAFTHSQPISCTATGDTTVGSTCDLDTTVEALVPGAVTELTRAIWELGAIRVHDGAGNLFLTQGVFVP